MHQRKAAASALKEEINEASMQAGVYAEAAEIDLSG